MANGVQPLSSHSYLLKGIEGFDGADRLYVTAAYFPGGQFGDFYAPIAQTSRLTGMTSLRWWSCGSLQRATRRRSPFRS
jgi:hypothetical protein